MIRYDEIVGQEDVKSNLKKAVKANKISHAYIFTGEAGMGRKSIANALAMTLLCEKGGEEPCMECHACKQVLAGTHPDLIYVKHEKPTSIGVDEVREQVAESVAIRPYSSYYKIYIVDEAEKMTVQAQNALLKTIEEPPSYAVIILLTTNESALLDTILSRCVKLELKPLKDSTIESYLIEHVGIEEDEAQTVAAFARGNLGKAIAMSSSKEFKDNFEKDLNILKNIKEGDATMIFSYIRSIRERESDLNTWTEFCRLWYRDILMFKVTRDMNKLIFKREFKAVNELGRRSDYAAFERILEAIDKAEDRLKANVNPELTLELLLLTMKEN